MLRLNCELNSLSASPLALTECNEVKGKSQRKGPGLIRIDQLDRMAIRILNRISWVVRAKVRDDFGMVWL